MIGVFVTLIILRQEGRHPAAERVESRAHTLDDKSL